MNRAVHWIAKAVGSYIDSNHVRLVKSTAVPATQSSLSKTFSTAVNAPSGAYFERSAKVLVSNRVCNLNS